MAWNFPYTVGSGALTTRSTPVRFACDFLPSTFLPSTPTFSVMI